MRGSGRQGIFFGGHSHSLMEDQVGKLGLGFAESALLQHSMSSVLMKRWTSSITASDRKQSPNAWCEYETAA
jgi:hypothetical protein